jgi:DNA helicase HerA-like ATPase
MEIYAGSSVESIAEHAIKNAPCTLVYDEIRVALPGGPAADTVMTDIVTYGRHYQVTMMGSTQRPALVSASLRALISRAFVFQVTIQNDLKWIAENIDPEIAKQAPSLDIGEYLSWF